LTAFREELSYCNLEGFPMNLLKTLIKSLTFAMKDLLAMREFSLVHCSILPTSISKTKTMIKLKLATTWLLRSSKLLLL
jgi:hypothetical protein